MVPQARADVQSVRQAVSDADTPIVDTAMKIASTGKCVTVFDDDIHRCDSKVTRNKSN